MILERALLRRFLTQATVLLAAATLLAILVFGGQLLGVAGEDGVVALVEFCRDTLGFLTVAVLIAVPLAVLRVLVELRRSGVLETCCAAGLAPARIWRLMAGVALLTAVLHAALLELGALGRDGHGASNLWTSGDHQVWCPLPRTAPEQLLLFRMDRLDVGTLSRSAAAAASAATPARPRVIAGREIELTAFAPPPPLPEPFGILPISRWSGSGVTRNAVLTGLVHLLHGPLLVLFAACLALLMPGDRLGFAALMFIGLALLSGLASATLTVLLWQDSVAARVGVLVWLSICLVALLAAHATYRRRGLRGALR
ncbi:MAG: hypothetical protein KDC98_02780 [Planctomycetes bacterium]|nr:hypothetical protein [Planctomycetota bacterium]